MKKYQGIALQHRQSGVDKVARSHHPRRRMPDQTFRLEAALFQPAISRPEQRAAMVVLQIVDPLGTTVM